MTGERRDPGRRRSWAGRRGAAAFLASILAAGATPLGAQESTVVLPGRVVERVPSASDPSQAYALYFPSAYHGARAWPLLLVMDPEGRAVEAIAPFTAAAERHGWIVMSSHGTREQGEFSANVAALNAMLADAGASFHVDARRIHLAGRGGMARLAWDVAAQIGDAVGGVLGVGALPGSLVDLRRIPLPDGLPFFGVAGTGDPGYEDVRALEPWLRSREAPYRLRFFEGGPGWPPDSITAAALAWFELRAARSGRRPGGLSWADSLLAADLAAAAGLEEDGRPAEALARYREILADHQGGAEVEMAAAAAARLAGDPEVAALLERRRREALRFQDFMERVSGWVVDLRDAREPTSPEGGIWILDLDAMKAEASSPEADPVEAAAALWKLGAARARLAHAASGFLRVEDPERALVVLDVAAATGPDHVGLLLLRAEASVALGRREDALDALERAVAAGGSAGEIRADPRFAPLRSEPRFRALEVRKGPAAGAYTD